MAVGSSACDSSELNLVKKKNTKSPVWNFFGLRADDNDRIIEEELDRPVCRECYKVVPAKGGNTSNLFWHLKEHHSALYAEISPISRKGECSRNGKSQQTLENAIARSTKYSRDSPQHKDITRAVAYHIGKDGVSLSTVESAGFKHMINKLNPKYDLPSRKYFSQQAIPALYIEVRDCLLSELKQVSHCAITTDLWTSCSTEPYITVTIHYINSDWELKSACLQTVAMLKDHTGQKVADCLMEIFANWEINPNKIVAATTDNGSNVVLAFELLQILRISCFGHNLDLCVKNGLDSTGIQPALSRCHSVVSLFNRSWKKTRDLKEKQQVLDLPQHMLKRDVSTRWGSTYEMLDRIIEQQQAICAVLAEDRKTWNSMPSDEEISVLETVKDVLENVFYLTDALAGEKEVTASSICCILAHLRKKLSANEGDCRVAIGMKERMLTDLNKQNILPEVLKILELCSSLDPRFKMQYLEDKELTISFVKEECLAILSSDTHLSEPSSRTVRPLEPPSTEDSQDTALTAGPPCKKKKGLSAILKHIEEENMENVPAVTQEDKIEKEVSAYLDYPKMSSETNPLLWWRNEQRQFPTLSVLARKYLCICGTSVPSERVFSSCGYTINNYRSRLHPKNVNYLIFLSNNLS